MHFSLFTIEAVSIASFVMFFAGRVNPYAKILTDLKIGKEDLKYYDLTKLEDVRYGTFVFSFLLLYEWASYSVIKYDRSCQTVGSNCGIQAIIQAILLS